MRDRTLITEVNQVMELEGEDADVRKRKGTSVEVECGVWSSE